MAARAASVHAGRCDGAQRATSIPTRCAQRSGNVRRVEFAYQADAPRACQAAWQTTSPQCSCRRLRRVVSPSRVGAARPPAATTSASSSATCSSTRRSGRGVLLRRPRPLLHLGRDRRIALVDRGGQGRLKRTSQAFRAWARARRRAPAGGGVCRFYARGAQLALLHRERQECDELKALEQLQRQQAAARGEPFLGWAYETIAFWALMPQSGQCPGGMRPVYRAYNDRAAQIDSNHRFMTDPGQRAAMLIGWIDEGAHLCAG